MKSDEILKKKWSVQAAGTSEGVRKSWERRRFSAGGSSLGEVRKSLESEGFQHHGFKDVGRGTTSEVHHSFRHADGREASVAVHHSRQGVRVLHYDKDVPSR